MDVDAAHDGRLVADIVAEWASLHGEPFTLHLTGPAGATFVQGSAVPRPAVQGFAVQEPAGETHTLDAIEFSRILAERADAGGVLRHKLPL
jgi:hypothetical protein